MAKQIQTIRRHPTNCLSVFDHLWGWHLKDQEVFLREVQYQTNVRRSFKNDKTIKPDRKKNQQHD